MLGTKEAAKLVGRDETTLRRAVKKGALSSRRNADGSHEFDPAELERWKATLKSRVRAKTQCTPEERPQVHALHEVEKAAMKREIEWLRSQLDDVRGERDKWQEQAASATRLLTHQNEAAERKKGFWARLFGS